MLWVEGGRSIISSASSQRHLQIHAELTLSPQNSKRQLVSAFHLSLQGMLQDVSEVKCCKCINWQVYKHKKNGHLWLCLAYLLRILSKPSKPTIQVSALAKVLWVVLLHGTSLQKQKNFNCTSVGKFIIPFRRVTLKYYFWPYSSILSTYITQKTYYFLLWVFKCPLAQRNKICQWQKKKKCFLWANLSPSIYWARWWF